MLGRHRHPTLRLKRKTASKNVSSLDTFSSKQTNPPKENAVIATSSNSTPIAVGQDHTGTAIATGNDPIDIVVANQTVKQSSREAEDAKKRARADRILNQEICGYASHSSPPSLTQRDSFGADDGQQDNQSHHGLKTSRHRHRGVVQRLADKHHQSVEKREKKKRHDRLKRFAALDPLQEAQREHGQAKETRFMALIRKYGDLVQNEPTTPSSDPDTNLTDNQQGPSNLLESQKSLEASADSQSGIEGAETVRKEEAREDGGNGQDNASIDTTPFDEHSAQIVDTLDVVDPGVSVAGHLSNIGNSIVFPYLPALYDRRLVIDLPTDLQNNKGNNEKQMEEATLPTTDLTDVTVVPSTSNTGLSSAAVNQTGKVSDLDHQDDLHLDAYVHELLTKRQKARRMLQGLWSFIKTPQGIIIAIYAFLVVFSGAALVLFLAGWIDHGKNKDYWVEVFSQFINALFTMTGIGLLPFRVRDTYRIAKIAYYQRLTWRLQKQRGLPQLADKNDIPSVVQPEKTQDKVNHKDNNEEEKGKNDHQDDDEQQAVVPLDDLVLTPGQAIELHRLQTEFAKSQSWYRPHATWTHHAFSIRYALVIMLLNDGNSLFQCFLCGVMWGYATHYKDRPAWTTGCLIPFSFLCGIGAGVLIWKGGEKAKKKGQVEDKLLEAFAREIEEKIQLNRQIKVQQMQVEVGDHDDLVSSSQKKSDLNLTTLSSPPLSPS